MVDNLKFYQAICVSMEPASSSMVTLRLFTYEVNWVLQTKKSSLQKTKTFRLLNKGPLRYKI